MHGRCYNTPRNEKYIKRQTFLLIAFNTLDWIINSSSTNGKVPTVHILGQDCIFSVYTENWMSSICSENDNKYSAAAQLELLMQTRAKCHL